MNIIFNKITIENFKGVLGKREILLTTPRTMILGANHTGKTTTADAAHWVLFGKNSNGKADFIVTPLDENGKPKLHIDNVVTLDIVADGKEYSLQRVRKEKWTKPRGQVEEVLSGYTTLYFVNGEKYTEKDYKSFIDGLIRENLFRAITNPEYFPSLKPDEQRLLLTKMVGIKSDEEISAGDEEFANMLKNINGMDVKEYRQHLSYKMKELKKAMEDIPGRISERTSEVNSLKENLKEKGCDYIAAERRIAEIDDLIKENQSKMRDCSLVLNKRFEEKSKLRKDIDELRDKAHDIERRYDKEYKEADRSNQTAISNAESNINVIKSRISSEEYAIKMNARRIEEIERRKSDFRKVWQDCENLEFSWDATQEYCFVCGRRLPQEDIDKLEEQARKRFNEVKASKQERLYEDAKMLKSEAEKLDAIKRSSQTKIKTLKDELSKAEKSLSELKDNPSKYEDTPRMDYTSDSEWQKINDEITKKNAELSKIDEQKDTSVDETLRNLTAENNDLLRERNTLDGYLKEKERLQSIEHRIKELTEQQRNLNQQLADLEKQDYIAERFQLAVIQDLQGRVNSLFPTIRFKMFNTLLNGSIEPTCVLTMNGVSYPNLSMSEKIVAGLECIEAMCKFNQSYAPIFIDNTESINNVPRTTSQQILLVVSDDDNLKVVYEK